MIYPDGDIIRKALKDLAIRYDIPELGYDFGFGRNDRSALQTEDIPFSVRGQFAAIVKSATVKAIGYYVSDFIYNLVLKFNYRHHDGSNGYSRDFMVICRKTLDGTEYIGVVESEVHYAIQEDFMKRLKN